jgi:hypothetical protein
MPWKVKKKGDRFTVVSRKTGKPVKGGLFDSSEQAMKHVSSLYANYRGWQRGKKQQGTAGY